MLNPNELTQKTREELQKMASDLRGEIRDFRFKIATRQHAHVRNLRHAKRDLARILTSIRQKMTTTPNV
jgi:ribosomal protein L29